MSRSQRYNDNDDDDNSDYSYEVTSNEDDDDDDDDFQIRKNKNISPSMGKSNFELNVPQHHRVQYQQHQQLQRQQTQQNRLVQKQKSKQKMKAKHYHVHPQRKPRRLFTPEEDQLLLSLVEKYGQNSWTDIAEKIPGRSSRQCKERYLTYLCPTVNHSPWTEDEDVLLLQKVHEMGKRWSDMSKFFNGRTANAIKNRYHLHLRGHFSDSRNKHAIQQQHHKEISLPLCARAQQQQIPHGSAVVMNTISNGFPGIPTSNTASSSPLAGAPPPASSAVFYAYPSASFSNGSNPYNPNLNGIILIPSNYDMPVKDRSCDVLSNNNVVYNGYNGYAPVEPQYVNTAPIAIQSNIVNVSNINNTSNNNVPNSTDYNYYNNNYYPPNKINTLNQNTQYIVNNANQTYNPNINVNINSQNNHNIINNRNVLSSNYSTANYTKDNAPAIHNHQMLENISKIEPSDRGDRKPLVYNINKKQSEVDNSKIYEISNFLVNNDNNLSQPIKTEEKPKEEHSKTRILLPSLQLLFPVKS